MAVVAVSTDVAVAVVVVSAAVILPQSSASTETVGLFVLRSLSSSGWDLATKRVTLLLLLHAAGVTAVRCPSCSDRKE